jgi:hypothetical protein
MLNLQKKSIEWSLKHITRFRDTYSFPMPFEFDAINENTDDVIRYIQRLDIASNGIRAYRSEITPKSQTGFRISTQLDPIDSIIYNAVLYEICEDIELRRVEKNKNIVYSFRLKPTSEGLLYDEDYTWESFVNEAERIIETKNYTHVVVTDIADFYPSIYLHNIETCLREAVASSGKNEHANVLINLIKAMHVNQTHKGLPIGPQISRPIAELILNEIDQILISQKIKFIRYVDDIYIFCSSENESYKNLAFVAQVFFDMRNLKLNESKTKIIEAEIFLNEYIRRFEEEEKNKIFNDFNKLCKSLGISTISYEDIDIDMLNEEQITLIKQLNILDLLKEEIESENIDLGLVKFLLNNLARFDNTEVAKLIISKKYLVRLFPIIHSIIGYLERVRSFSDQQKHEIGMHVLELFDGNFVTELQFIRVWLLSLFTKNDEWNNKDKLSSIMQIYSDADTMRELLLCYGRAKIIEYFRQNKMKNTATMTPWERRAFIAAISCLPKDERNAWYSAQKLIQRDYLDKIVEIWAQKNHF